MEELEDLLAKCKILDMVNFKPLQDRIWCYAHIINICSSYIVASFTSTSKSYLSVLKVPLNPKYTTCHNLDDDLDDDNDDDNDDDDDDSVDKDYKLELPGCYNQGNSKFSAWAKGIKSDPLRHA